jgi:hypothetical protein
MIDKYDAVSGECWKMMLLENGEVLEMRSRSRSRADALARFPDASSAPPLRLHCDIAT